MDIKSAENMTVDVSIISVMFECIAMHEVFCCEVARVIDCENCATQRKIELIFYAKRGQLSPWLTQKNEKVSFLALVF